MNSKRIWQKALCLWLCVMMFTAGIGTAYADSEKEDNPITAVYAASDFQPYGSGADDVPTGQNTMRNIIRAMVADGYQIGGALLCGDYSKYGNTWSNVKVELNDAGSDAVAAVLEEELGLTDEDVIYVQGNHDPAETKRLDKSGENDTEHYGVYVLHEDEFRWKQGDSTNAEVKLSGNTKADVEALTKAAAEALGEYLQQKWEAGYAKPIFVCSHVPLHYSDRTYLVSEKDNLYAKYVFDVLNRYGEKLNIIFLFGHNHSDDHDDYLGGGSIYLPAGDEILIPRMEEKKVLYQKETLNFTYMNAGYLGYYAGDCEGKLTSTVFEIYEDRVEIARYAYQQETGEAALADLKAAGVWSIYHRYEDFAQECTNTTVYESIQTVHLQKVEPPVKSEESEGTDAFLTVVAVSAVVLTLAAISGVIWYKKKNGSR